MNYLGKSLVVFGIALAALGIVFQLADKLPGIGRLPGDIYIRKGPVTFYFPVVTSLAISLILSLAVSFFWRK